MFTPVAAILLAAQNPATAATPERHPPEIEAIVGAAQAVPPEFKADTLLRLVDSGLVKERAWKVELIEEAFTAGGNAQWPYKRRGGLHTDTRPSREAWDRGLDSMALQAKSVEFMLELLPQRARELFGEIRMPVLARPSCQEVLTPDVDSYYQTASRILESSFTPRQRKDEEHVNLLLSLIQGVQSPTQVFPVANLIQKARLTPEQRGRALVALAASLERTTGTDRLYSARRNETASLIALTSLSAVESPPLVLALRGYIVRHDSGPRCSDTLHLESMAVPFNSLVEALRARGAEFRAISPEEVRPGEDMGTYQLDEWWQSQRSREILAALKWLTHGNRELPDDKRFWTAAERATSEWNEHYLALLALMEGWKEDQEPSAEDYFGMKADIYRALASLVPDGPARDNARRNYIAFLESEYARIENRNLGFGEYAFMLDEIRSRNEKVLWPELLASANPVIALYANLEFLIRRAAGSASIPGSAPDAHESVHIVPQPASPPSL